MDAKSGLFFAVFNDDVSIHAPVMDAKMKGSSTNPKIKVSIHAPVMDAKPTTLLHYAKVSFNPRARDGREHHIHFRNINNVFQSTRP